MPPVASKEWKAEFKQVLNQNQKQVKVNSIFKQAIALLTDQKIIYPLTKGHPDLFFVHPKNRGGLGLSWHNAHRNAKTIHHVGADLAQLVNAYAMEMASSEAKKAKQIEFNVDLISRSDGLLARPTGHERFLTLGCGHTVAACRAANAGCKTSEKELADEHGILDKQKLANDKAFNTMMSEGWDWQIIPSWIDDEFPEFADIAQKSLNASNHVASLVGEIETAKCIADIMRDGTQAGWENDAIAAVVSMGAPSSAYSLTLVTFVAEFTGGVGAPLLVFLDHVAKEFQCNATLGELFWVAVTNAVFWNKVNKFPLNRCGLILTNLTSNKFEDGIAKLLVRGDVAKVASKKLSENVAKNETLMSQAFHIADQLHAAGKLRVKSDSNGAVGRFMVRLTLRLVGKQKEGREGKEHSSETIQQMFLDEMSKLVGSEVNFDQWSLEGASAPTTSDAPANAVAPVSLADHGDLLFVAKQEGFKVGAIVFEKEFGCKRESLYEVTKMDSSIAVMKRHVPFDDKITSVTVEMEAFIKEWAVLKSDPPYKMDHSQEHRAPSVQFDLLKSAVYQSVVSASAVTKELTFFRRPDCVVSNASWARGSLVLAPLTPLQNMHSKHVNGSFCLGEFKGVEVFAIPPPRPAQKTDFKSWAKDVSVIAFWWILSDTTANDDEANMHIVSKTFEGKSIKVMTNSKAILPNTRLMIKKVEPVSKKPLANVISVADPEPAARPKKKSRT